MTDKEEAQLKVAVLNVRNVRTLDRSMVTKETRIQQYLESLPQRPIFLQKKALQTSTATAAASTALGNNATDRESRSPSPGTQIRSQPLMIRSNSSGTVPTCHARQSPSSSPICKQESEGNDMSNLQPSVEEELSRLEASLHKCSSDSCSCAKGDDDDRAPHRTSLSLTRPSLKLVVETIEHKRLAQLCLDSD